MIRLRAIVQRFASGLFWPEVTGQRPVESPEIEGAYDQPEQIWRIHPVHPARGLPPVTLRVARPAPTDKRPALLSASYLPGPWVHHNLEREIARRAQRTFFSLDY
jgi:hypothetical protein